MPVISSPIAVPESAPIAAVTPRLLSKVRRRGTKWVFACLTVAMLISAAALVYSHRSSEPGYVTAKVDRGDIDATVTTTGNLNAVITVQVGSQVSGNIIALYADFNTKVKKGQLVAEIDPAPFKASVDQATATLNAAKAGIMTAEASLAKAQSDLASAEANVANQKANLTRAQSAVDLARVENERRQVMVKTGSTSQEDADTSAANYNQAVASAQAAEAAVAASEAAAESAKKAIEVTRTQLEQTRAVVAQDQAILAQAELNLNHTRILAPVDGTVESRNMDIGQTVAASFQAPVIFLIAQDLTRMQVDTNVDESDVGAIRLGQPATFTVDAFPGQIFRGRVAQIRQAPINVQNVITYDIVIEVANPDLKLFPGMTANATIYTGQASNALRIPKAALRFHPRGQTSAQQTVYVRGSQGQPSVVRVGTGISDANRVEVTSGGLTEGQELITGLVSRTGATETRPPSTSGTKKLGF